MLLLFPSCLCLFQSIPCFLLFPQVFEDDWTFSQAPDSGCPSESLLEEEAVPGRANPDLLPASSHHKGNSSCLPLWAGPKHAEGVRRACLPFFPSDRRPRDEPRPPAPPPLSSATHEHLGLEWDPSVDVGRSVSPYEADSSYFSANAGRKKKTQAGLTVYHGALPPLFFHSSNKLNRCHLICCLVDLLLTSWSCFSTPLGGKKRTEKRSLGSVAPAGVDLWSER